MDVAERLAYLTKGCVDVVRHDELRKKLERSARTGKPLTVKVGFDPTAPDLHLGHTVLLRKMKHFQDLGHRAVFVIGDFTGLIGDPTGRSKTRPALTREEIARNAETYKSQVFTILDPDKTVLDFNSRWLTPLGAEGLVRLAAKYSVAQMLERRDFKQRSESGKPIAIHEFLYPLAQAYDSVFLEADVELGGTDQLFNLNVGRDIMPGYNLEPQIVMTTPLLEGLDGVEKMSKSLGNYVGVTERADEMFGKIMSIGDELMWRYYLLLTDLSEKDVQALRTGVTDGKKHPKAVKMDLARRVVGDFHSAADADKAAHAFEARFARKDLSTAELPEVDVDIDEPTVGLPKLLAMAGLAASATAGSQLIAQGGVRIDGRRIESVKARIPKSNSLYLIEAGRRAKRVRVR